MDGFCGGGDAEEGRGGVEGHAVDGGGEGTAAELVEFVGFGDGEDADDGAFVGGGREEGAGVVEGDVREGGAVGGDNVDGFEFRGVEEEDVTRCGGDMGAVWGGVRRGGEVQGEGLLGEGVGEIAVVRGRGEGADC